MDILEKYNLQGHDSKFYYQFLGRLRSDCEYYLGNGGRYHGHLWAGDEYAHIRLMKAVYELLPVEPEWLTREQLKDYERRVLPSNSDGEVKMNQERSKEILKAAIYAYECELEQQDYESADALHAVVLNELSMTEDEYLEIVGEKYQW